MSEKKREHIAPAPKPEVSERPDVQVERDAVSADSPIGKSRESFETKHGEYLTTLSKTFRIDRGELVSLVARESRFDTQAKHSGGSSGLMQLTSIVFEDLKVGERGRAAKYYPLFRKLDGALPPDAPKALSSLVAMAAGREPGSAANWNRAIAQLRTGKFDPITNLTVGSVTLAWMASDVDRAGENPKERQKRGLIAIFSGLEHPKNLRKIVSSMRELGHVGNASSPETIAMKIAELKNGVGDPKAAGAFPARANDFLTLRKYNGNPTREAGGILHRDLYAAIVMFSGDAERSKSAERSEHNRVAMSGGQVPPSGRNERVAMYRPESDEGSAMPDTDFA